MDEFIDTVQSQTIPLGILDTLVSVPNLPYVFFYENASEDGGFMPSDTLRNSFYKALQQFPILAGYLRSAESGLFEVVVDRNDLNMPEYSESTSDIHYKQLESARYSWDMWPKDLSTVGVAPTPAPNGRVKHANVHIVRLKDNSGLILFLNMPHILMDGVGYFAFFNLWARLCKQMRSGSIAEAQVEHAAPVFDRSIVEEHLPSVRKPLDAVTASIYTTYSAIAEWVAWLSLSSRWYLVNKSLGMADAKTHVFHVSEESLELLHQSVSGFVPQGVRLSNNDLITALVSKTIAQAQCEGKARSNSGALGSMFGSICDYVFGKETHQATNIVCDIRHRLGIPADTFVGNSIIAPVLRNTLDELLVPTTAASLASIAIKVRQSVDYVDQSYIAEFIDMVKMKPSRFAQVLAYMARNPSTLAVSNQTRFRMYAADFGDGSQRWATLIPSPCANIVAILPSPPPSKGVQIYMATETAAMKLVLQNESWTNVASVAY
ncbi:transferase family protein [Martensiomyces pterosporus]|nr:transferase family protein [Martensiomyces pterosporus]